MHLIHSLISKDKKWKLKAHKTIASNSCKCKCKWIWWIINNSNYRDKPLQTSICWLHNFTSNKVNNLHRDSQMHKLKMSRQTLLGNNSMHNKSMSYQLWIHSCYKFNKLMIKHWINWLHNRLRAFNKRFINLNNKLHKFRPQQIRLNSISEFSKLLKHAW